MVRPIPPEVLATWPAPNYVDPIRRGPELIGVCAFFIAVVAIAVFLRLYVRIYMLSWKVGVDDVFIVIAFLCAIVETTLTIIAYEHYGWDRHLWDLPISKLGPALYLGWWTKIVYSSAAMFTRLSLLLFYYRLTQHSHMQKFRWGIHISMVVSVVAGVSFVLLTIFQCAPVRAFWAIPPIPGERCLDDGKLTLGCGIANTFADVLVVLLPIPIIMRLQLPVRRRIGAAFLVSLGFVVCIAGAVRAYYTWLSLINSHDKTWDGYGIYISAAVEIDLGVICACAPALRVLFAKFVRPRISNMSRSLTSMTPFNSDSKGTFQKSMATSSSATALTDDAQRMSSLDHELSMSLPKYRPSVMITPLAEEKEFGKDVDYDETDETDLVQQPKSAQFPKDEKSKGPAYMWDEPWNGKNAPTPRHDSANTDIPVPTPMSLQYEIAVPVRISQVSQAKSVDSATPARHSQASYKLDVVEQSGMGVLPTPPESMAEHVSSHKARSMSGSSFTTISTVNLPIQGLESPRKANTGIKRYSSLQTQRGKPLFNLNIEDLERRQSVRDSQTVRPRDRTKLRAATSEDGEEYRTSWFDQDNASTASPRVRYVKQQNDLLREAILHDRVRALNRGQKSDSIGWEMEEWRPPSALVGVAK